MAKTGPWGQGPVLLQALAILDGYRDDQLDPGTADGAHLVAEALKLAFADREAWYGDRPDTPLDTLLSTGYAAHRRTLIDDQASTALGPGSPDGLDPRLPRRLAALVAGVMGSSDGDPAVRVPSPAGVTSPMAAGAVSDTTAAAALGEPTLDSLAQSGPDEPVTGRYGEHRGDTCHLDVVDRLFLLRQLVGGLDLQAAIDAPNFHTTSLPSSFFPREIAPGGLVVEERLGLT